MHKYLSANNTHNYIDALDGMIKKCSNTVHNAIEMKPKDAVRNKYTIKVYNAFNDEKAVIVEQFNRTLKTSMYIYLTANNTFNYSNALDGIVRKYSNTIHSSIKMKPKHASLYKNTIKVYNAL